MSARMSTLHLLNCKSVRALFVLTVTVTFTVTSCMHAYAMERHKRSHFMIVHSRTQAMIYEIKQIQIRGACNNPLILFGIEVVSIHWQKAFLKLLYSISSHSCSFITICTKPLESCNTSAPLWTIIACMHTPTAAVVRTNLLDVAQSILHHLHYMRASSLTPRNLPSTSLPFISYSKQ